MCRSQAQRCECSSEVVVRRAVPKRGATRCPANLRKNHRLYLLDIGINAGAKPTSIDSREAPQRLTSPNPIKNTFRSSLYRLF